jgi:hypothetical protein
MMRMQRWGVTGWSDAWKTLGSDVPDDDESAPASLDGYGFERTVDPSVVYLPPTADIAGVPRWHVKAGSGGRILQMSWPEDTEPSTRSLVDLQASIAVRRRGISHDDPELAVLDAAVDQLVAAAAGLHAAGRSLGYFQPESCRVGTWRDGSPYVSLPDVGFAWDKRAGLMIPNWIAEPDLEMLFDDGAERRNDSCFAEIADASASGRDDSKRAAERAASELADVRLLARLVAVSLVGSDEVRRWCGGKNTLMRLPSKDVAPDTHARIWDEVIAPALGGQIRTCDELRVRLAANRPSSHFLHVPPAPPWAGWAVLRRAAVVGLAAATLGLLWVCFDFVKPFIFPPRAPFCSAVPKSDPLYEKLVGLKASRDAARSDVAERPAFWSYARECLAEHAAFKACGRDDCLDPVVEDWLLQAEEEGRAVRERLRSRPQPTAEEVRGLKQAVAAIHEVELQAKRQGSSTVVPLLVRELKLRGGELPTAHVEKTDPE